MAFLTGIDDFFRDYDSTAFVRRSSMRIVATSNITRDMRRIREDMDRAIAASAQAAERLNLLRPRERGHVGLAGSGESSIRWSALPWRTAPKPRFAFYQGEAF